MPPLPNIRHEMFAHHAVRGLREGLSQRQIYFKAGYKCSPAAADVNACRLLKQAKVQQRISELIRPEVRKTLKNVRTLLLDIQEAADEARAAGQHGVFIGARSKQAELMIRANDVSPDAFADVHSIEQIRARIASEYGADAVAKVEAIVAALRGPAEAHPILIEGQVVDNVEDAS